jgi:hypothetical protein
VVINILVVRHRPGIRFKIVQFPSQRPGALAASRRRVIAISNEKAGETSSQASDEEGEALRQELGRNVVEPAHLPPGYQLEGPAEPGADADVPGVLGGPGISIVSEDEDEPENRWPEHPR